MKKTEGYSSGKHLRVKMTSPSCTYDVAHDTGNFDYEITKQHYKTQKTNVTLTKVDRIVAKVSRCVIRARYGIFLRFSNFDNVINYNP